jgi:hypothetical protein
MKYARKCSVTGEGMNEGWVWFDGMFYTKYEKDTIKHLRRDWGKGSTEEWSDDKMLEEAVEHDVLYWTMWEDESEHQYEEINGKLIEIQ